MFEDVRGAHGRQPREVTIEDLGLMVVAEYRANGRRTVQRVEQSYRLHLIPFFRSTPVNQIGRFTPAYRDHRLGQGAAPATVRLELMNLSRGFKLAALQGDLPYPQPIVSIRVQNVRQFVIPERRVDDLLAYLPYDVRDTVEMLRLTGWRTSEVTGLLWTNVDWWNHEIRLEPGTAKNGRPRVFPFDQFPQLETLLRRRWQKTVDAEGVVGGKIALVFHRKGNPIRRFYRSWRTACRRAGLEGAVPHDLRRTARQSLRRADVPDQTAMDLAGHKTRSSSDRYGIVEKEDLQEGTRRLAARLSGSRSRPGL
jgi:integrase